MLGVRFSQFVKVFGCRPHDDSATCTVGRRTKTSKGGNRAGSAIGAAAGAMGV
jgi:hypothetical protein